MPRILIHFARYGPYHHARLRSAHEALAPLGWEVIGLETAGNDDTYAWEESQAGPCDLRVITAFPGRVHEELTAAEYQRVFLPLLDAMMPDVMAIAGWASTDAMMCRSWCGRNKAGSIVMSETRAADGRRVWWKELIKRFLISHFDGALVGGKSHRDYLMKLGMNPGQIAYGYNVVDNAYFAEKTEDFKTQDRKEDGEYHAHSLNIQSPISDILSPYFLASNRFIERKNLLRLIESYASYIQKSKIKNHHSSIHPLCLLGDGGQKPALIARCKELGLEVIESAPWEGSSEFEIQNSKFKIVFFPGFRQIDELPRFYAHASCFIHPALEEPWGLVLNEAMACGLPILSGDNVGAAESLIDDGVNGWKFDATDVEALAGLMLRVSAADFPSAEFAAASRRIIEERAPTAAFGLGLKQLLANFPTSS